MPYEDKAKIAHKPHNIHMEDRKKLNISGVEEVESFDESQIVMITEGGSLIVKGSDLNISKLSLESGDVSIQGLVTDLCYEEFAPSGSLWARLFR